MSRVTIEIPGMRLASENALRREHWAKRRRRENAQACNVNAYWFSKGAHFVSWTPPVRVRLTRVGKALLDGDNLQGAFKHVRDEIARLLKLDDADPRIAWEYGQEIGAYGVRIEIEERKS